LRQQFAIDLLDQADAEPADEAVEDAGDAGAGDAGAGESEDDAAGAPEDEADASADVAELAGATFVEANDVTARVVVGGVAPCDATGGPHLET
jgi:hypothetical protein